MLLALVCSAAGQAANKTKQKQHELQDNKKKINLICLLICNIHHI